MLTFDLDHPWSIAWDDHKDPLGITGHPISKGERGEGILGRINSVCHQVQLIYAMLRHKNMFSILSYKITLNIVFLHFNFLISQLRQFRKAEIFTNIIFANDWQCCDVSWIQENNLQCTNFSTALSKILPKSKPQFYQFPITYKLFILGTCIHWGTSWKMDVQWDPSCIFKTLSSTKHCSGSIYGKPK